MLGWLRQCLTNNRSELPATESVKETAEGVKAVFELAEVFQKEGPNVQALAPLVGQLDSLLDVLNSPLADIVEKSVPFLPIATGLLKFYLEKSKKKPTLENCVELVSQAAYLESLKELLQFKGNKVLLQQIGRTPVSENQKRLTRELANLELSKEEAERTFNNFPNSRLAKAFREVLYARLVDAELPEALAQSLVEQVVWDTPRYMKENWSTLPDKAKQLGPSSWADWNQEQTRHHAIKDYLTNKIQSAPDEKVFNEESLTLQNIYVPMEIRQLDQKGEPTGPAYDLATWVKEALSQSGQKAVLFIQGEAGRGKSVFCCMFADWVRTSLYPAYIPILIRLRDLRRLDTSLTETLANCLENYSFAKGDWLTDKNTRFLFLLDGFDELLLRGDASDGMRELLPMIENFQKDSHHQFLITGRPLSFRGIEQVISERKELKRVALQELSDALQDQWYDQWAKKFGAPETEAFKRFLAACPPDVHDILAREPLLLYLLGRMHREQRLYAGMFAGAEGMGAKIIIYDKAIRWVIQEQRQGRNWQLTGLEKEEDLRRILMEAALCVVQSGNEATTVEFLKTRLEQDSNPQVRSLFEKARNNVRIAENKLLDNFLTAFYIKPAAAGEGSVEFVHKSFCEFLFAQRLQLALETWSRQGSNPKEVDKEIYDLLGYGGLTVEIMDYLRGLLNRSDFNPLLLFERLQDFYLRWWAGEFIDALVNNLPQGKMRSLQKQIPERETRLGLRQVDAFTGFNVMILLFNLHRYGQAKDDLKDQLTFHPCGELGTNAFDRTRLYRIMGYGECLEIVFFTKFVAPHLSSTDLSSAVLVRAELSSVNLSSANLSNADLFKASLSNADLSNADLSSADLSKASLSSADLSNANLFNTNLFSANLFNANLSSADLGSADLGSADLGSADLSSANLSKASLSNANLFNANLFSANLFKANLNSTDLFSANLNSTNLFSADLSNANLFSVDLTDADLRDVRWNEETQWANAKGLHRARNVPAELSQQPQFAAAVALSRGMDDAETGNIPKAIAAYEEAQIIDSTIQISAASWGLLCWKGSLQGYAADVLFAGEHAVRLSDESENYQRSRGPARALTGDRAGALEDFQAALDRKERLSESQIKQLEGWVAALRAGENPFTPEVLEALRQHSGF